MHALKDLARYRPVLPTAPSHPVAVAGSRRLLYLQCLNWCFALFSSTRLLTYLPTLWAIHQSGDASQHSLLTWAAWAGSNGVTAAWLYENNDRQCNRVIVVTCGNLTMCLVTCALIGYYRWVA